MKFIDHIETKFIDLNVPFSSKKRLFEQLSVKMAANEKQERVIYDALVAREKVGVTALGNGVALPHGKCLEDKEVRMHIMVLNTLVNYESVDDTFVQLIVCILFPKTTEDFHENLLKNVGNLFKKHRIFREIIGAKSAKEIKNIILKEWS